MVRDHPVVGRDDVGCRAVGDDRALVEQEHSVAVFLEGAEVVAHQHDGLALAFVPAEGVEAFLLEAGIADRQDFVHHEQVGLRKDRDAERQPHLHARGEVLELLFRELLQLGEGEHLVDLVPQLRPS